ncbi:MAG: metallophosphoesterase [Pedobacter sp.]|nr:metallophosphoesterase [Pedobacter sp.]
MAWTRRRFLTTGIGATLALLLADAFWFEKAFIQKNEFSLKSSSSNKVGLKFIQISDLHLKSVNRQLRRLAEDVNQLRPDLIFLTGDAIDDANKLPVLEEFLKLISFDLKKVAILGNWEYWSGINLENLRSIYAANNTDLLINEGKQYKFGNKTAMITGIDDLVGGNANITDALKHFKTSDCHIILNHCPQYTETIVKKLTSINNASAIISGHTHGGQVNLFGFVPYLPQGSGKYLQGWYDFGPTRMYVSRGIGTSLLPVRFGSRAEVAVFNI